MLAAFLSEFLTEFLTDFFSFGRVFGKVYTFLARVIRVDARRFHIISDFS